VRQVKKEFCLNGAAARKVQVGDKIIVIAYTELTPKEADEFKPKVAILEDDNEIAQVFERIRVMFDGFDINKMQEMPKGY